MQKVWTFAADFNILSFGIDLFWFFRIMTSHQNFSPHNRRSRKLPTAIRRNRNARPPSPCTTFYTYRNALQWMRGQRDVISRCIQLLQTYPNLIQDESMDRLWEFIEPLVPEEEKEAKSRETNSDMDISDNSGHSLRLTGRRVLQNTSTSVAKVPEKINDEINRSQILNENESKFQETAYRLQIISHRNDDSTDNDTFMHRAVIGALQEDFYVKVPRTSLTSSSSVSDSKLKYQIPGCDLCVYFFTESTLENPNCFLHLCTALSNSIPVVYVKRRNQHLQENLSNTVKRSGQGCSTMQELIDLYLGKVSKPAAGPGKKRLQGREKATAVSRRPSSARERNKEGRRGKRKHSPVSTDNELTRILSNGFNSAFEINELQISSSCDQLKQIISRTIGSNYMHMRSDLFSRHSDSGYANKISGLRHLHSRPHSHKPFMQNKTGTQGYLSSPERHLSGDSVQTLRESYDSFDANELGPLFRSSVRTVKLPPLEQQTTTYLLFDRNQNSGGPKRVEFPIQDLPEFLVESDLEPEDMELIESPIQFHEIDLSRKVNGRMTPESENSCSSWF
ncbi:uncharacterized protein LOC106055482 [Biomphalaria glabrata]|uniref:Uncharacterized protein LOC106055482 n=1 Tax=Biomphalaria glabrata TaxID=6526 RepID=A0A9U8DZ96_BIOGL|nr:uncharacterized protein LOC106055482 [Biomphalaria glabrata]XP_013067205.2 uncharacterized protein LOC106055482 [Biomphalaria glabrata]XP_013067206.2 uncharacterized protein LOC106055482 [Biomphalaria glabrata]